MKPVRQCGGSARSDRHRKSWSSSSADGALNETTWHRRGGHAVHDVLQRCRRGRRPATGARAAPPTDRDRAADPAGGSSRSTPRGSSAPASNSLTGIGIGWARLDTGADIAVDDAMPPPSRQSDEGPTPGVLVGCLPVDASERHPVTAAAKPSTASTYRATVRASLAARTAATTPNSASVTITATRVCIRGTAGRNGNATGAPRRRAIGPRD